uniref:mannose-6-phosphate isomerase n=1 Tax=Glossina brevipalpis TaxID=37001 RepID=A0A1A9W4H8_9MUSC
MELIGYVQNYDWGKLGNNSEVAQLTLANTPDCQIDEDKPYAELWMGDHQCGPSIVKSTGQKLNEVLKERLSYLFKVLSIRKALSIQVHPNKKEAEKLHKDCPGLYDANHKPELAIALTPFTALCGFRPNCEIYEFCKNLPPLKKLLGGDKAIECLNTKTPGAVRPIYRNLMTTDEDDVAQVIQCIADKYMTVLATYQLNELFMTLNRDYPNDVGVLSLFFLNVIYLKPGESIYLDANEIHAYIYGDCVECMACSDNVIRAGLTPKYKDVERLLDTLNYTGQVSENKIFKPKRLDANVQIFAPPVKDFAVLHIQINDNEPYTLKLPNSSGILLVLKGKRLLGLPGNTELTIKRGSIIYLSSQVMHSLEFKNFDSNNDNKDAFIAYIATRNRF